MVATTRLYQNDSLQLRFTAEITGLASFKDKPALQLDQTTFYPEGGGQPGDHGRLVVGNHTLEVTDVQVDEAGLIHHLLHQQPPELSLGDQVEGLVDETRRRDFMSQHTGQHMLSALVDRHMSAPTLSARLGSKHGTIDVEGDPALFSEKHIAYLEKHLQQIVLENRPINILYPDAKALVEMGLRRAPKVSEGIRIIEVTDFDKTPCGGTHCQTTGQVGPIKIIGRERYKGMTRLSFLAGQRALTFLFGQERLLREISLDMGCAPEEVYGHIQRMRADFKHTNQQLGQMRSRVIAAEAADILAKAAQEAEPRRVLFREGEDYRASRQLASALTEHPTMVVLIASRQEPNADWRVIVARGAASSFDCGGWFRGPGKAAGARGGGKPDRAEGVLGKDVDPASLGFV